MYDLNMKTITKNRKSNKKFSCLFCISERSEFLVGAPFWPTNIIGCLYPRTCYSSVHICWTPSKVRKVARNNIPHTVTGLRAGLPRSRSIPGSGKRLFSETSRLAVMLTQPYIKLVRTVISSRVKRPGREAGHHLHLMIKSSATPLLPQYAFMV